MRNLKLSIIVCCALATAASSVLAAKAPAADRFSSRYTDLSTHCESPPGTDASTAKGAWQGDDPSRICRGVAPYATQVDFTACHSVLHVTDAAGFDLQVPSQDLSAFDRRKIEWRLHDGKPFAIIVRVSVYRDPSDCSPVSVGQNLLVRGLRGHERISGEINAWSVLNANEKARALADRALDQ